jgi:hypothetical protein
MNKSAPLFTALAVAILSIVPSAEAQRTNLSARDALGLVSTQFGPQATQWIAEMRAQGGIPQPSDWQVLAYDQRAPKLLYRFWAGGGRAGDGGIDDLRYPDDVPVGYFSTSQISVDSVAAFTIAEGEARKARMAFDSCDYLLRLREYSTELVWRLELLDASRRLVGKLYISGNTGEVLRTIWVYRDQRARPDGQPLIVDSMAPGGTTTPVDLTGTYAPTATMPNSAIAPGAVIPPMPSGIVTPQIPGQVPGQVPGSMTGIQSVPLPPAPGVAVAGNAPYAPVDANGRPMTGPSVGDGIPSPPPLTQTPSTPSAAIPAPPAPTAMIPPAPATIPPTSATIPPAPATKPAPSATKPPITPSTGGGGDSERIPPPPIPR